MKKTLIFTVIMLLFSAGFISFAVIKDRAEAKADADRLKAEEAAAVLAAAQAEYDLALKNRNDTVMLLADKEASLSEILRKTEEIRPLYTAATETAAKINEDLSSYFLILVNRDNKLPDDFEAPDLQVIPNAKTSSGGDFYLNATCLENILAFRAVTNELKYKSMYISAHRSIARQQYNWDRGYQGYLDDGCTPEEALEKTKKYYAEPGYSEHHTGLAVDINESNYLVESLENTAFFKYALENIHNYGFILRYPKDKVDITGYAYEPWHFRFVGVEHATYMKENDLCLEEYIALLNENLAAAEEEAALHEAQINNYEAASAKLIQEINDLKETISSLQEALDKAKSNLSAITEA